MLRPDILNVYSQKNSISKLDIKLREIGGTFYKECYTSAPDTPRSNGCLWTSQYPSINGCTTRMKYPRYFLSNKIENLIDVFYKNEYECNFYMTDAAEVYGDLPSKAYETESQDKSKSLDDFLKHIYIADDSFTYLGFDDFHYLIDDCHAQRKYIHVGLDKCGDILNHIDKSIGFDTFDYIYIFSDHGFRFSDELFDTNLKMIDSARTRLFLFVHKKGDKALSYDHELRSIMDIFPTVCNTCGFMTPNDIKEIKLCNKKGHEFIFIEDHKSFTTGLGQVIDHWAIRDKDGLACMDIDKKWESNYVINNEKKRKMYSYILKYGAQAKENVLTEHIWNQAKFALKNKHITYFDGTERIKYDIEKSDAIQEMYYNEIRGVRTKT